MSEIVTERSGSILRIEPIEISIALDVHSVRRLALNEEFEPVMNQSESQLGPLGVYLILVRGLRRECGD